VSDLANNRTMRLHALDAWVRRPAVLTDAERVREILYAGAEAGGATVLGEKFCVFPNGAVTGVLVLAQSHLSIHTWPEYALANVDLLSYGALRGEVVLDAICEQLDVERVAVTCVPRAIG
jgi:S-adenosylmethionine decarboxylase